MQLEQVFSNLLLLFLLLAALGFGWAYVRYKNRLKQDTDKSSRSLIDGKARSADDIHVQDLQDSMSRLPDAIMLLDDQLRLDWANQIAENWFGFRLSQHFQQELGSLLNLPAFDQFLESRDYKQSFDCTTPGSPEIEVRIRIVPFRHGQYLLQARDVTQVKVLEQMRRDFVANASHELRTPISVVYGYLDMMMEDTNEGISQEWRLAIMQMHEQTNRLKQIIDDMMTLSRLEDPEYDGEHEFVELAPLLESAGNNAAILSGDKNHRIRTEIESECLLYCNRKEIESLITNLVSNAVRYTPEKGSIIIRWLVDASGGSLSVIDTGIGMAADELPRITERFYRTDSARSRETGGTGLGLAIINHIVNRHQAKLTIESQLHRFSIFTVQFPSDRIRKIDQSAHSGAADSGR
jgi:two-component system phosphate regulon sensor histidine kinase PhoR